MLSLLKRKKKKPAKKRKKSASGAKSKKQTKKSASSKGGTKKRAAKKPTKKKTAKKSTKRKSASSGKKAKKSAKKKPSKKAASKKRTTKKITKKTTKKTAKSKSASGGKTQGVLIARVDHYFDKIKVAAFTVKKPIKKGDTLYFEGGDTAFKQKVTSMQIEHETVERAKKGASVGIKVKKRVREGYRIYKL